MKKRLKVNGIIIILSLVLVLWFPALFMRRYSGGLPESLTGALGMVLILLGQIIRVSARGYKSDNSGKGTILIQGGPYTLVRNPMYLGILLIGLGVVLMLFKWWVAVLFTGIFIIRYLLLIFEEEKKLSAFFSREYRDYLKRVPRLFPSLSIIMKSEVGHYLPLKLSWLKKESGSIAAVLFGVLLIESWANIARRGLIGYLKDSIALFITIGLFILFALYLIRRTGDLAHGRPDKS